MKRAVPSQAHDAVRPVGAALGGRFELRGVLGSGRLGATFRARDRHLDQDVALKVLRPELFPDTGARNRLRAACLQAQRLSHTSLARVLAVDTDFATPYFAGQLVDGLNLGRTLARRLDRGRPFTLAETARLVRQISTALDLVYVGYPAHGLLKLENVILLPGLVKLTDYHLASALAPGALDRVEHSARAPGLAPELLLGLPLSPAADVYSLALLVVELLTGETPRSGEVRPSLNSARPELPRALELLLDRCLDEDPFVRLPTPRALAHSLSSFLENDGGFRQTAEPARIPGPSEPTPWASAFPLRRPAFEEQR